MNIVNGRYLRVNVKDHPKTKKFPLVGLHILAAEQKLGRNLKPDEVVHHIDMNKHNNNQENLMVFATFGDHAAFHKGAEIYNVDGVWYAIRKQDIVIKECPICSKLFVSHSGKKSCSEICATKLRGKTISTSKRKLPDAKLIIENLYQNNGNMTAVGKMYNVSDKAISDLLRREGYLYHSKDYKK